MTDADDQDAPLDAAAEADESVATTCEAHPKQRLLGACEDCGRPLCYQCAVHGADESPAQVKQRAMRCAACTAAAERPQAANVPKAAVFGAVGALIGAAIWAAVLKWTNTEVGYIAWAVGALAGFGVVLGARPSRGRPYQITAVTCAIVGVVIGKYWAFVIAMDRLYQAAGETTPGAFSGEMLNQLSANLSNVLGAFDLLWIALAVGSAWQIPASTLSTLAAARKGARTPRRRPAADRDDAAG